MFPFSGFCVWCGWKNMDVLQLDRGDNLGNVWEVWPRTDVLRSLQRSSGCSQRYGNVLLFPLTLSFSFQKVSQSTSSLNFNGRKPNAALLHDCGEGDVPLSSMVDPRRRAAWIAQKVALAKAQFMDGINLDIEQAVESESPEYFALTQLVNETTVAFHREIPGSQVNSWPQVAFSRILGHVLVQVP